MLACWFSASARRAGAAPDWGIVGVPGHPAHRRRCRSGSSPEPWRQPRLNLADRFPAHRVVAALGPGRRGGDRADRAGRRRDRPWAVTLRFVTGVALAGVYPVGMKLMTSWFDRGRGFALGVLIAALTLGSAMPQLVSSFASLPWRGVLATASVSAVRRGGAWRWAVRAVRAAGPSGAPARAAVRAVAVPRPRTAAGQPRLLRPHVGALRDVDLGAGLRRRQPHGILGRRCRGAPWWG